MQKTRLASLLLLGVIVSIALSSSLAFAQTTNSTATVDVSGIPPISAGILKWTLGVIWAGIGYGVAASKGEKFDPKNFGVTVLIGFIIAGLTTLGNIDPTTQLALVGFLTPILDKLLGKTSTASASQKTGP